MKKKQVWMGEKYLNVSYGAFFVCFRCFKKKIYIDLAFTECGKKCYSDSGYFEKHIFNPCLFLVENFITHLLNKIFTPGKMYIISKASITRANNLLIYF